MIQSTDCQLAVVSAHLIGNIHHGDELILSAAPLELQEPELNDLLIHYFLSHFTVPDFYSFSYSNNDFNLNPIYSFAKAMFEEGTAEFHRYSQDIARHLFEFSDHPQIKSGELYVAHFRDVVVEDEVTDAIGLFKSEIKQPFLKMETSGNHFRLDYDKGINIEKLDKGCLIFNLSREQGYKVAVIDKTNKGEEARYWKDKFLMVKPCADNYHFTESYMKATKKFVTSKEMQDAFEVDKADQIGFLNASVKYFRDNSAFSEEEFASEVFKDEQIAHSFQNFRKTFQEENNLPETASFEISEPAVKKQARILRSVLKLDKNFHIYVHGNRELIEKGYDEVKRKHYYKLYFDEEK